MSIRSFLLLVLLVVCVTVSTHADDLSKVANSMASVTGMCNEAIINNVDLTHECGQGFISITYKTGRVAYIFFVGAKPPVQMVTFGGDKAAQLADAHYVLYVDSLDIYSERIAASGSCVMEGNAKISATYTCEAHSVEPSSPYKVKIVLKSKGAPHIFFTAPKQ